MGTPKFFPKKNFCRKSAKKDQNGPVVAGARGEGGGILIELTSNPYKTWWQIFIHDEVPVRSEKFLWAFCPP